MSKFLLLALLFLVSACSAFAPSLYLPGGSMETKRIDKLDPQQKNLYKFDPKIYKTTEYNEEAYYDLHRIFAALEKEALANPDKDIVKFTISGKSCFVFGWQACNSSSFMFDTQMIWPVVNDRYKVIHYYNQFNGSGRVRKYLIGGGLYTLTVTTYPDTDYGFFSTSKYKAYISISRHYSSQTKFSLDDLYSEDVLVTEDEIKLQKEILDQQQSKDQSRLERRNAVIRRRNAQKRKLWAKMDRDIYAHAQKVGNINRYTDMAMISYNNASPAPPQKTSSSAKQYKLGKSKKLEGARWKQKGYKSRIDQLGNEKSIIESMKQHGEKLWGTRTLYRVVIIGSHNGKGCSQAEIGRHVVSVWEKEFDAAPDEVHNFSMASSAFKYHLYEQSANGIIKRTFGKSRALVFVREKGCDKVVWLSSNDKFSQR